MSSLILTVAPCLLQDMEAEEESPELTPAQVAAAGSVAGLDFTEAELELMLAQVRENLAGYGRLQELPLENAEYPALRFDPLLPGLEASVWTPPAAELVLPEVERPADLEELVWADIPTLASLVRSRRVTCVELTELFLARLERLDGALHCTITLTRERALKQARALDAELAEGNWRGPLHGIPWGAKDLLATRGVRTTWGAAPFKDQVLDHDATVVERLDAAGAVLVAKLTLGALAWGDVWYGETTRNPWKPEQGSSGSSAGSASATAAGCVPFAIGSETLGSIVSPSARCGNTALRPTFGRVSRHGAMTLSWSMDKLGPICRSVGDAALVFEAIQGPDERDPTATDLPYRPARLPLDTEALKKVRVGVLAGAFESDERLAHVPGELRALGIELVPVELPEFPVGELMVVLQAEAATAFDELTRSGRDELMVRQIEQAWPNVFRVSRLIPAVEYIRANRLRVRLMRAMDEVFREVDLYVHPNFAGGSLSITNLTGHPTVVAPAGFRDDGTPFGVSFTGRLYDEALLLAVADAWQRSTTHHLRHPDL